MSDSAANREICQICGDSVIVAVGKDYKCENCGVKFRYIQQGHVPVFTAAQQREMLHPSKRIETYEGDTKVAMVTAVSVKTGIATHWVCKTPKAQRELAEKLKAAKDGLWDSVTSSFVRVQS